MVSLAKGNLYVNIMKKSTEIHHTLLPVIEKRKSTRAFAPTAIDEADLYRVFEAARWSFSSANQQAWRFVYAHKNQPLWHSLFDALMDGNKPWNSHTPVLILTLATKQMSNGKPYFYNLHDVGAATMAMSLQAVSMGMQIHPMAGFHKDQIKLALNIPDDLEPVTMLALGYPGTDLSMLNENQQAAELNKGERYLLEELIKNKPF